MDINLVMPLAAALCVRHGIPDTKLCWGFSKKSYIGLAIESRTEKTIKLSKPFIEANIENDDFIKDVILHEIAHILAGGKNHHNDIWKRTAASIGANPCRTASEDTKLVKLRYKITCTNCGKVGYRARISSVSTYHLDYRCGKCKSSSLVAVDTHQENI